MIDQYNSPEQAIEAYLWEMQNTSLFKELQTASETEEGKAVGIRHDIPHHYQAGDALGCVVACNRMALEGAGSTDVPDQNTARRMLEKEGLGLGLGIFGGMIKLDRRASFVLAQRESAIVHSADFRRGSTFLTNEEGDELEGKTWPAQLAMAIKKGFIVTTSLPMKYLYGGESMGEHAIVLHGAKYDHGTMSFFVRDPLGAAQEISAQQFIAGRTDQLWSGHEPQMLALRDANASDEIVPVESGAVEDERTALSESSSGKTIKIKKPSIVDKIKRKLSGGG